MAKRIMIDVKHIDRLIKEISEWATRKREAAKIFVEESEQVSARGRASAFEGVVTELRKIRWFSEQISAEEPGEHTTWPLCPKPFEEENG